MLKDAPDDVRKEIKSYRKKILSLNKQALKNFEDLSPTTQDFLDSEQKLYQSLSEDGKASFRDILKDVDVVY